MEVTSACTLINNLVFWPDWSFEAVDHTNRFEGTIVVKINYPARQTERAQAPEYPTEIRTYATFPIVVSDLDEVELCRVMIQQICCIHEHETREALRVQPTMWAPFHPHRVDGMRRWGDVAGDLRFGIV